MSKEVNWLHSGGAYIASHHLVGTEPTSYNLDVKKGPKESPGRSLSMSKEAQEDGATCCVLAAALP
jgi:hypothetical protein